MAYGNQMQSVPLILAFSPKGAKELSQVVQHSMSKEANQSLLTSSPTNKL